MAHHAHRRTSVQITIGRIDKTLADAAVADGEAIALNSKGTVCLVQSPSRLAKLLQDPAFEVRADVARILRAADGVQAERLAKNAGGASQSDVSNQGVQ